MWGGGQGGSREVWGGEAGESTAPPAREVFGAGVGQGVGVGQGWWPLKGGGRGQGECIV